ncbi:MAG: MltA domain-containing protein [Acidobacteria bacterium]|nr:MltA domain-containing protein [Acidobacteriota bacterium]
MFLLLFLTLACAKAVVKLPEIEPPKDKGFSEEEKVQQEKLPLEYGDKLSKVDLEGFLKAIEVIVRELDKNPDNIVVVKEKKYSNAIFSEKLKTLNVFAQNKDYEGFSKSLVNNFEVVKITEGDAKTLFTGYYIPLLEAKKTKDDVFKYPIYSKPDDLVSISLSPLGRQFKNLILYGRINEKGEFVPYYSRKDIDKEGALKNKNLELCYLKDPLDVLMLQIQGSGFLNMEDGEILIASYAGKNGREYKSIGKYIAEKNYLPKEEVSWNSIREFLQNNPEKFDEVIYHNPSYVFFSLKKDANIVGSAKLPLIPFHSIAVDKNYIPLLSLCLINFDKPIVGDDNLVKSFQNFTELAFAVDEGAAIKGAERIDLFCGFGEEAEKLAHTLKSEGELYILVPKLF